jgi:hypothetical protein
LECIGVGVRILLKWVLKKYVEELCMYSSGPDWEQVAGSCEHDNEPSGSIKFGKFLEWLKDW